MGKPQGGPGAGAAGRVPVLSEADRDAGVVDDQPGRVVLQQARKSLLLDV